MAVAEGFETYFGVLLACPYPAELHKHITVVHVIYL
jgi:hypothetical protein